MLVCATFALTACVTLPFQESVNDEKPTEIMQVYNQYVEYAKERGETPLSYEEWLASIKGEKGDKGDKGDQGETGPQGPQGDQGEDGLSAYQIWLANGNSGTQADFLNWLKGQKGDQGETGPQGPQGDQGDKGDKGDKGDQGETGPQGPQGEDGKSAYQIWLENGNTGTEEDFLNWLKGVNEHNYGEWKPHYEEDANCSEGLLFYRICLDCGKVELKVDSVSHTVIFDSAVVPTCTEAGLTEGSHCDVCGAVIIEQEEIPALGHDVVVDAAVEPTCTESGLTEGTECTRCGETHYQEVIPAPGHHLVIEIVQAPTCIEAGIRDIYCDRCGCVAIEGAKIPALGHDYSDATCREPAICQTCGYTEGEPLGYNLVEDPAVPATCTETGLTAGSHCDRCGETFVEQEVIPALGHNVIFNDIELPTCTKPGCLTSGYCDRCGEISISQVIIPALGHDMTEATCTEPAICQTCGYTEGEPLGHTPVVDEAVDPTCTETGLTAGSHCAVCGEVIIEQEVIPALGHHLATNEIQAPTCAEPGIRSVYCDREGCGHVVTTAGRAPALGHDLDENGDCKREGCDYTEAV